MIGELDNISIGCRIKTRRKELKLTQTDIKQSVGISSGNMSDMENGKVLPTAWNLLRLSEVLKCSIDWILTGKSLTEETDCFSLQRESENQLLTGFRKLPEEDQEELLEILEMKLRKVQRSRNVNSKSFDMISNSNMTG